MPKNAILNRDGVLVAYEIVSTDRHANPPPGEVAVPEDCDLEPDRYRWDGQRFAPVAMDLFGQNGPKSSQAMAEGMAFLVAFVPAVVATMKALDDHPAITLPPVAADWLAEWDSGGAKPPRSLTKWIQRYRALRGERG